jgi:hypothetical protein
LLAAVSSGPEDRKVLEAEMSALTRVGNEFRIRHHETTEAEIDGEMATYFFLRMYALTQRLHPAVIHS